MSETPKYLLQTGDGAGWIGSEEPADLAALAKRLAEDCARYRMFPDAEAYYRVVEERLSASGKTLFQRREKNPHAVAARLRLAQVALNNTHWWLDDRNIPDRPPPETPSGDEDEAGRQLSRLLIWLEKTAKDHDGSRNKPTAEKVGTLDERALALFFADRSRTKKAIADLLHVSTQSLSPTRCPQLDNALKAWRTANAAELPRGTKDRDGNLEAWKEDE